MLLTIEDTIRLCGLQNIPIRHHDNSGCIQVLTLLGYDGNFRGLVRYRIEHGDLIVKNHVENSTQNAMHTIPKIQNALIDLFSQLIQKIIEHAKESQYFTILVDDTSIFPKQNSFPCA